MSKVLFLLFGVVFVRSRRTELGLGSCPAAIFPLQLQGHQARYDVPATADGSDQKLGCNFGPYGDGTINFRCQAGQWMIAGMSCKKGTGSTAQKGCSQCEATLAPVTLGGVKKQFQLPTTPLGGNVEHKCNFGELTSGSVTFTCSHDCRWKVSSDTCRKEGQCAKQSYTREMHGHSATFSLGRVNAGGKIKRDCSFGPYSQGHVWFKCVDGLWSDMESDCLKEGQCPVKAVKHKYGWTTMDVGEAGAVVERDCKFGALDGGKIKFSCADALWKYNGDNCHQYVPDGSECPERDISFTKKTLGMWMLIKEQNDIVPFHLEAGPVGMHTVECGEGYDGWATFECHQGGNWTLLRAKKYTHCWSSGSRADWNAEYLACAKKAGAGGKC